MSLSIHRRIVQQIYSFLENQLCSLYSAEDLNRSAMVFSPHYDDETLGCGGTIYKKKSSGAKVWLVFMTDGSKSHKYLMNKTKLKTTRRAEGTAAGLSLGLKLKEVIHLQFEETKLNEHQKIAIPKVIDLIKLYRPEEIFIPYHKEPLLWSEDHITTTNIVLSALRQLNYKVIIYEYPIWFWRYWPWTKWPTQNLRKILSFAKISLISGISSLKNLRCRMYIGDVLGAKRVALGQHKSQTTRLVDTPNWSILGDVWNGEFLKRFFQNYEVFYRHPFIAPEDN